MFNTLLLFLAVNIILAVIFFSFELRPLLKRKKFEIPEAPGIFKLPIIKQLRYIKHSISYIYYLMGQVKYFMLDAFITFIVAPALGMAGGVLGAAAALFLSNVISVAILFALHRDQKRKMAAV